MFGIPRLAAGLSALICSALAPLAVATPAAPTAPAAPAAPLASPAVSPLAQESADGVIVLEGVRMKQGTEISGPHTVVVRSGLIAEILPADAEVNVHASATQVEAADDWVIYPGLIHADFPASTTNVPESPYLNSAPDPRDGPIPHMPLGDRADLMGWLHISDVLDWNDGDADDWRELGFTSAHILPKRGLVRGRSALVSLNDLPLGEALLLREGHQVYSLRGGRGGYGGTPMAGLAMLRQFFLDADRMQREGMRRRADADMDELGPAIFVARNRREIENVLDLHLEFAPDLPLLILGGDEAWIFADRLQEQNVGVLYRANFGEAPKADEDLDLEEISERPYWQEPARLREDRRRAHAEEVDGFRLLQESGVACALVPGTSASDWSDAWQQYIDAGWAAEDLWQAASLDVATLLGIDDLTELGAGSPADFTVFAGEPGPDGRLAWVFADGHAWEFELEDESEVAESGESKESEEESEAEGEVSAELNGGWKITVVTPMGDQEFYAYISTSDNQVELGDGSDGERDQAQGVGFSGDRVKFNYFVEEMEMEFTFFGKVDGDSMTAKLATDFGDVPATGVRVDDPQAESSGGSDAQGEDESSESDEAEENTGVAVGHPEWLVELESDRISEEAFSGSVLIQGGMLHTLTGDAYVGDLLIEDGKITAVGRSIDAPSGVPTFDAEGMHVSPAMLDAHSHLALAAINEGSVSITAEVRIEDMIMTGDYGIYRAAAGGTALVQSLHGSANPIGGQAAVWEMDYAAQRIADVVYPAQRGVKFALGENVKQSNWNNSGNRFPNSRMGVQATYRRAFRDAQDYIERRRMNAAGDLPSFRRDVRLEVLADILQNKIHIQCHSYRADELLMFLHICEEFGIKAPTFQHVLEGYKVAPELAAYGAMGSTFADWWAYKIEAYDAIPWNPGMMHEAGMISSINSDSDDLIRRLNTEAGKSLRYGGWDVNTAMSFATKNVATQLRIDETLGTLEVGKHGTVTVWDAAPLSTYARCVLTLARGRTIFAWKPENDEMWQQYAEASAFFAGATLQRNAGLGAEAAPRNSVTADDAAWKSWTHLGEGKTYLLDNVQVHSMVEDAYMGHILISDGRLAKVGKGRFSGRRPRNAEYIDAKGKSVYPSFINSGDATGLYEIGSVNGTDDRRETGAHQPDLSIASAIHADSAHHHVTRFNGISHVLVSGGSGRIRGQAALIQLAGVSTDDMVVSKDLGLVIRFPRASAPRLGQLGREIDVHEHDCLTAGVEHDHDHEHLDEEGNTYTARDGVEMPDSVEELDDWFDDALDYGDAMDELSEAGAVNFARDAKLEALVPYARGEKPVFVEADDAMTIMAARAWGKDRGIEIVYVGALEAWKVAGYLGADKARVLLGSVMDLPRRAADPYDASFRSAMVLRDAGCQVSLRTDNPEVTRNLPFQAATAGAWGLSRDGALRAITIDAARNLGVDEFTGSIEEGKAANLILCDGDPLDFTGKIEAMWIGGSAVELTNRQTELRDRYQKRIDAAKK